MQYTVCAGVCKHVFAENSSILVILDVAHPQAPGICSLMHTRDATRLLTFTTASSFAFFAELISNRTLKRTLSILDTL